MNIKIAKYKGIHPGLILDRILIRKKINANTLAQIIDTPRQNIYAFLHGKRGVSIPLSLKIDNALALEEGTFALLQTHYQIQKKKKPGSRPNLKKLRKVLFWDTDIKKIDWEKQYPAIISRVFERGNKKEQEEILRFYGNEKVERVLANPLYNPSSKKIH